MLTLLGWHGFTTTSRTSSSSSMASLTSPTAPAAPARAPATPATALASSPTLLLPMAHIPVTQRCRTAGVTTACWSPGAVTRVLTTTTAVPAGRLGAAGPAHHPDIPCTGSCTCATIHPCRQCVTACCCCFWLLSWRSGGGSSAAVVMDFMPLLVGTPPAATPPALTPASATARLLLLPGFV